MEIERFNAYLTAVQIQYPALATLYSLNSARIDFIPYQFRPVLRFIRSDRPKLLIADGVGIGKTIEAGLILRELQARREIRSILIICPRPLVVERKWEIEMKRFDEYFTHLDGKTLRHLIREMDCEGIWPEQYSKVILPYSLCDESLLYGSKKRTGLLGLDPPPRFDLVIVDEAHHVRNPSTYSHKVVRFFCDHAEAVLFLTATPIQLGRDDLFVLLNMLRPDLIIDQESYMHMAEPNPHINMAAVKARKKDSGWQNEVIESLMKTESTPWGQSILKNNPVFKDVKKEVSKNSLSDEERVKLINDIESLYTFSGIINRTRRKDIADFTVRKPETVIIEFTPQQKELHDDILRIQSEILGRIHGNTNIAFMISTIRRQAASCIHGLIPLLENILNRHIDELEWDEADDTSMPPDIKAINDIRSQIDYILEKAKRLDNYDPKLNALANIIKSKQKLKNKKIMLFSSFRHTLKYLHERLMEFGIESEIIHGGTPDDERIHLRDKFKSDLDVLLFSEIGCEGLDYQFCDCIVNYDLPWNPMRIEQRIGRIDRKGQESEAVLIYNMITPKTVDADIYERCLIRIGVFNSSLGASDDILGEITREIKDIAENIKLTDEEKKIKFQQLADNKIRLIHEEDELEKRQNELFGLNLSQKRIIDDIENARSYWLSPGSIQNLVSLYLQQRCLKEQELILGEKPVKTLRLSQEARNILLKDFNKIERQKSQLSRQWEQWLKSSEQHLSITFDSETAKKHPSSVFIMPVHPLAKQAASFFGSNSDMATAIEVKSDIIPQGIYEFAIYKWNYCGFTNGLALQFVSNSTLLNEHLKTLIEKAVNIRIDKDDDELRSKFDQLDSIHHSLWKKERAKHRKRTEELADYRRESLNTSHRSRIGLLREQLAQANDDKIKRMRQSQIDSAHNDYSRRMQEIDIAIERAEITTDPIAYGIISIKYAK